MKFITVIIFITLVTESFAQFTKGDKVLGGSFSLRKYGYKEPENTGGRFANFTTFGLQANFGLLIRNNLEIGALLGHTWDYRYEGFSSGPNKSQSRYYIRYFTMGFYMQRYFPITEKFLFALQGEAGYSIGKSFYKSDTWDLVENRENKLKLKLSPKLVFFPSANWGLYAGLGNISYTYSKVPRSRMSSHSFDISYGSIIFGASYYFRH